MRKSKVRFRRGLSDGVDLARTALGASRRRDTHNLASAELAVLAGVFVPIATAEPCVPADVDALALVVEMCALVDERQVRVIERRPRQRIPGLVELGDRRDLQLACWIG
jgi:hypothetical protein